MLKTNQNADLPQLNMTMTQGSEQGFKLPKQISNTPANRPSKVQLRQNSNLNNVVRNAREEAKVPDETKLNIAIRDASAMRGVSNPRNMHMAATMRMASVG